MIKPIAVYDNRTKKRVAFLQNAYNISYEKSTNTVWTAEFSLPFSDPKTKHCLPFNYVELWEEGIGGGSREVGLFRIMPRAEEVLSTEANVVYKLEHVISTLLDDVMIGYHEIGNINVFTNQVIGYILEKQTDSNWVLGTCAYNHQFLYGWQDENLLSALFSVTMPFEETDYYWDFDTTGFPWRINLLSTNKEPVTDIRYKKNLNGLTRTVDPTNLTTRLYCYGYGEGDNKLNISDLNNGLQYLESPNISKYGVITQIWTDDRFTIAESLHEVGAAMLKKLEEPAVYYDMDIRAVYNAIALQIGDTVRVISPGLDELMTVRTIIKDDVTGAPQSGKILLGDATIDISNSIAEIADRQRIAETYSQGAESIFTDSFADNADPSNPAEIVFTIPSNVVHVNEIRFSCQITSFRAYSRAVKGGGSGTTTALDGGGQSVTSGSGGSYTATSSDGGGSSPTSSSGGGSTLTSESAGSMTATSLDAGGTTATSLDAGGATATVDVYNTLPDHTNPRALHNHGIPRGSQFVESIGYTANSQGYITGIKTNYVRGSWAPSGDHTHRIILDDHSHRIALDDHSHRVHIDSHQHTVYTDNHTHYTRIDPHQHTVVIPTHTHNVTVKEHSHQVTLPGHSHGIEYGIYKGPRASRYTVYLDDKEIGVYTSSINDINLIDYMSKNANGNIMRGSHTIRIKPNTLTRVECTFQIRLFTNMHGGRQY